MVQILRLEEHCDLFCRHTHRPGILRAHDWEPDTLWTQFQLPRFELMLDCAYDELLEREPVMRRNRLCAAEQAIWKIYRRSHKSILAYLQPGITEE